MRRFLPWVALLALAAPADSQIFAVKFKDQKAEKRYSKHLVDIHGEKLLLGELRGGVEWQPERNNVNIDRQKRSEWFVCDPGDPSKLPYKVKDGLIGKAVKKQVVGVQNSDIEAVRVFARRNSWYGVSLEYAGRRARLEELIEARDALAAGTNAWELAQAGVLDQADRTGDWLRSFGFTKAADKTEKEVKKIKKLGTAKSTEARRARAMQGIGAAQVDAELTGSAVDDCGGRTFRWQQSQHCVIRYHKGIPDKRIKDVLELAENAVLGFRGEFVAPYLADDFADRVPEEQFIEWYFGPDDVAAHERMFENHFGLSWGPRKKERLQMQGNMVRRGGEHPEFLYFWRIGQNEDLPGIIANNLGVALASLNYSSYGSQVPMDWVEEALGYWISLEFLGRNVVTNKEFEYEKDDGGRTVGGRDKKDKDKTVGEAVAMIGERAIYLETALADGSPLHALMTTELFDMHNGDLAKSWAMFDFLARRTGREGQVFLRAMGEAARDSASFHQRLREIGDKLFEIKGQDVFRVLDERWTRYAREQLGYPAD